MRQEYVEQTHEVYIPQECEAYGFNELGGLRCIDGYWVPHCNGYQDCGQDVTNETVNA